MIDINSYTPLHDIVLIKIEKHNHALIYSQRIKTVNSGLITFDFDMYINEAGELVESKEIGEVVKVGPKCTLCLPGDLTILDYTVDMDNDCIVHETEDCKYVAIHEKPSLAKETKGYWNQRAQYCQVYNKGDEIQPTSIFGIIRDGVIICNANHVIFTFEDAEDKFELSPAGIYIPSRDQIEGDLMELTVEFAPINSLYKRGDTVLIYKPFIFTKTIHCNSFLMAFENDILCTT